MSANAQHIPHALTCLDMPLSPITWCLIAFGKKKSFSNAVGYTLVVLEVLQALMPFILVWGQQNWVITHFDLWNQTLN